MNERSRGMVEADRCRAHELKMARRNPGPTHPGVPTTKPLSERQPTPWRSIRIGLTGAPSACFPSSKASTVNHPRYPLEVGPYRPRFAIRSKGIWGQLVGEPFPKQRFVYRQNRSPVSLEASNTLNRVRKPTKASVIAQAIQPPNYHLSWRIVPV